MLKCKDEILKTTDTFSIADKKVACKNSCLIYIILLTIMCLILLVLLAIASTSFYYYFYFIIIIIIIIIIIMLTHSKTILEIKYCWNRATTTSLRFQEPFSIF